MEARLPHFSREGLRYALERQPPEVRARLLDQHKAQLQAAGTAAAGAAAAVVAAAASSPGAKRPGAKRKARRDA